MKMLEVPIGEIDIESFKDIVYKNNTFKWVFADSDGNDVCITFMSEDEYEQRSN